MPRKTKGATRPIAHAVPQNRKEAETYLTRIGAAQRERERLRLEMDDRIAELREAYAPKIAPLEDEVRGRTEALQTWAEANRQALTGGKTKTVRLTGGWIAWRNRPPRVTLRGKDGIVEACKSLGLDRFVRITEEPNKEAMLAEPDVAAQLNGVSIGSAGEDFTVEADETELEAVR